MGACVQVFPPSRVLPWWCAGGRCRGAVLEEHAMDSRDRQMGHDVAHLKLKAIDGCCGRCRRAGG